MCVYLAPFIFLKPPVFLAVSPASEAGGTGLNRRLRGIVISCNTQLIHSVDNDMGCTPGGFRVNLMGSGPKHSCGRLHSCMGYYSN